MKSTKKTIRKRSSSSPATPRRRAVLILGMHRSGTSALAKILSLRGAELPAEIMPANEGNPTGYWEPKSIVDFNDELLGYFGVEWSDPFASAQISGPDAIPDRFYQRATRLIDKEYGDADLFVLKDPRCTLLAGFWIKVLDQCGVKACPVVMMRPYLEVADSLRRRDGTSLASATLVYVAYAACCVEFDKQHTTTFVTYTQLLKDWKATTDRIASEHRFKWPKGGAAVVAQVEGFLHPSPDRMIEATLPDQLQGWADCLWSWINDRSNGKAAGDVSGVLDELDKAGAMFAPVVAERTLKAAGMKSQIDELRLVERKLHTMFEEAQATLQATATDRDHALGERDALLAREKEAHENLNQIRRELTERAREVQQRVDDATDIARQRDELETDRNRILALFREQQQTHSQLHAEIGGLRTSNETTSQEVARLHEEREAVVQQRNEFEADRNRALERLRELESEHAALAASRESLETEKTHLGEVLESSKGQIAQLTEEREAVVQQRDEFEVDRNRALERLRELESEHAALTASRESLETEKTHLGEVLESSKGQIAQLTEEREAVAQQRDEFEADRDRTLNRLRELETEHAKVLAAHEKLCGMHEDALQQLDHTSACADALAGEVQRNRAVLDQIYASRSWAITRPLRGVASVSRSLLAQPLRAWFGGYHTPRLPAPETVDTADGTVDVSQHPGLASFLDAEFGADAAGDVITRIDGFKLPVDSSEVRLASRTSCDQDEAVERAKLLASKASSSALDADTPLVSIVIPVYNQIRFTLACLDSLLSHETRYRFEVLVGDDCSTDATAAALATPIFGIRHVRHEANLGFVRNCNATAVHAKGRYVVFLNNDTLVLPGWLDELVEALERDEQIGLVGSKLVYPDGRLQECGAIIWNDGSAWNLGRFDDPRKPEYCYLRDVDYVSGASIMLRTNLWHKLGGFDELFAPAYAEDADLAFRVRAEGLRTVVQPLSQILHFEGVTSGTDTSQGAKAYQVENLKKLHERWGEQIRTHRVNADRPELEKERNVQRRVLFIDKVTPTPNADAGSVIACEVMTAFRKLGYKVTFIPEDNFAHMGADTANLQRIGVETIYHPSYSFMTDFLAARHDPFDVVFMHRYPVAEAHLHDMRKQFPTAKIVFLNADMYFLREMREAELSNDREAMAAARKTRSRELAIVDAVDCTLVHSDFELGILHEECPDAEVRLFPLIQDPVPEPKPIGGREGVCFVGGYQHPPNVDAIVWFVNEAWPQVIQAIPDAKLYIAGSRAPYEVVALGNNPGVQFAGFVDDLDEFLAKRRVSVAPLRYGAGAKGKVAISLAHGLPSVCTPVAVEGMQLTDGHNVLVGKTPEDLARHVIELLRNDETWKQISTNGLTYADEVTARRHALYRIRMVLEELGVLRPDYGQVKGVEPVATGDVFNASPEDDPVGPGTSPK